MEKAFVAARDDAASSTESDVGKLLMKIGMTIARTAPSTMGTLVATGFMSGGKAVGGTAPLGPKEMAAFFDAFVSGIMQRGKSKPGEKTIVDVLYPAAQALKAAADSGAGLADAFRKCRAAAAGRAGKEPRHAGPARTSCVLPGTVKGKGRSGRGGRKLYDPGLRLRDIRRGMIQADSLFKRYGTVEAVRGVSFRVDTGSIVGLLGPNGAGKTFLMRILTCYHFPSSGAASVEGHDVTSQPDKVRRVVGYLPGERAFL